MCVAGEAALQPLLQPPAPVLRPPQALPWGPRTCSLGAGAATLTSFMPMSWRGRSRAARWASCTSPSRGRVSAVWLGATACRAAQGRQPGSTAQPACPAQPSHAGRRAACAASLGSSSTPIPSSSAQNLLLSLLHPFGPPPARPHNPSPAHPPRPRLQGRPRTTCSTTCSATAPRSGTRSRPPAAACCTSAGTRGPWPRMCTARCTPSRSRRAGRGGLWLWVVRPGSASDCGGAAWPAWHCMAGECVLGWVPSETRVRKAGSRRKGAVGVRVASGTLGVHQRSRTVAVPGCDARRRRCPGAGDPVQQQAGGGGGEAAL